MYSVPKPKEKKANKRWEKDFITGRTTSKTTLQRHSQRKHNTMRSFQAALSDDEQEDDIVIPPKNPSKYT